MKNKSGNRWENKHPGSVSTIKCKRTSHLDADRARIRMRQRYKRENSICDVDFVWQERCLALVRTKWLI